MGNYTIFGGVKKSQERQASKKFNNKCSKNSRSQIVFRTGIFRKWTLGAPGSNFLAFFIRRSFLSVLISYLLVCLFVCCFFLHTIIICVVCGMLCYVSLSNTCADLTPTDLQPVSSICEFWRGRCISQRFCVFSLSVLKECREDLIVFALANDSFQVETVDMSFIFLFHFILNMIFVRCFEASKNFP